MFEKFSTLEALYQEMDRDKNIADIGIASANRYPLRFVLFENFSDFYEFIQKSAEKRIQIVGIEKWMDAQNPDIFPTYSTLARRINEYIDSSTGQDVVLAPFSELARFYSYEEFRSLLTTIRLKEANCESQEKHLRIYVPLIGMQNKLEAFRRDKEIHVWEYVSDESEKHYHLILCNGLNYGLSLDIEQYSCCNTVHEWVALWRQVNKVKSHIICSSKTIFAISENARPDNSFDYTVCHNAYDFIRNGLRLIPQDIPFNWEELVHWEKLASEIKDVRSFSLENFVLRRFNVLRLEESEFMQFWFTHNDSFSRWLLRIYYLTKFCGGKYLCNALTLCSTTHTSELFEKLALLIFDENFNTLRVNDRRVLLSVGRMSGAKITEQAELRLRSKLIEIAENPEYGYIEALKYITSFTEAEKQLLVAWLGEGKIGRENIKTLLPDLYAYTAPMPHSLFAGVSWLASYINEYRSSKIANRYSESIAHLLKSNSASTASFETWRNEFKTVKTILANREDIEIYYWIDGLGIDWVPFICKVIEEHQGDGVFLNEVYIGSAQLPTITSVNKAVLVDLSHANLRKIGDLDTFAHTKKIYPDYICHELQLVRESIQNVLKQYNGKKIAFVSDHGISHLAQHGGALSVSGTKGEHYGRCATWKNLPIPHDKKYVIAPDGKMICSLSHDSLADKTPYGVGAHGGATPEEVLVPIVIVSGQKTRSNYTAELIQNTVTISEPIVRYKIKGVLSNIMDVPVLKYNGDTYSMREIGNNLYESAALRLVEYANEVTLVIGSFSKTDSISVKTGVCEDDIFGDF